LLGVAGSEPPSEISRQAVNAERAVLELDKRGVE
jgi:hypothetical protein